MGLHDEPRPLPVNHCVLSDLPLVWASVEQDALLELQRYRLGRAGCLVRSACATLFATKEVVKEFRVVTLTQTPMELAAADTLEEALWDVDVLRLCAIGALPAEGEIAAAVSAAVQEVLASRAAADTQEVLVSAKGAGSSIRSRQSAASPDTEVPEPEPWAVTLLENADKLRYACYALRIASSLGADVATTGLGGQEVVKLCFVSVDALLTSSWLAWFTSSLLDDSPGSNVIRQTMALDFAGGPSAVISQVDAICMNMNPADRVHVIQLTMALKRRIAVIVGDLCSMMMTKDAAVTSAMVTELLVQLQPLDASHGLQCLVAWYGMIAEERRGILEDSDRLNELLSSATSNLGDAVQREYDLPLSRKALNASRRHAPLLAFEVVAMVTPAAPLATAMAAAHLAGSLAISANVGRDSCEAVFGTLRERMPEVVAGIQKSLALSFATLVLLAHCSDGQL